MSIDEALRFMANAEFSVTGKWQMLAFVLRQMCSALGIDMNLIAK